MPVRAELKHLYPKNWPEIAAAIKWGRAGGRCECAGECGRSPEHLADEDVRCRNRHGGPVWGSARAAARVVLACAHLNHTPEDARPEALISFCGGCHLAYDLPHHLASRRANRIAAMGLVPLF